MRGEKIYDFDAEVTGTTDFGIALSDILDGSHPIPAQGARFDVAFAGRATGRLAGRISGIDYVYMRADGRVELNIRSVFETPDGARISLLADGVGVLRAGEPVLDLSANVSLLTASKAYEWVNARQIWSIGFADLGAGKLHVEAYLQ